MAVSAEIDRAAVPIELLTAVLESKQNPAWIIDAQFRIEQWNSAFGGWLSAFASRRESSRSSLVRGMPMFDVVEFCPEWQQIASRSLAGRTVIADVACLIRGAERRVEVSATPTIVDGAVSSVVFSVREKERTKNSREDVFELALNRIFDSDDSFEAIVSRTIEFFCEAEQWECSVVWLLDQRLESLVSLCSWSIDVPEMSEFRQRAAELRFQAGSGLPGRAWSENQPVWVSDLLDETAVSRADPAQRAGIVSAVAIPLTDSNRFVGVLELFSRVARPFSNEKQRALDRAGRAIGRLIARRQSEDERRELIRTIERRGVEWMMTFDAIELPIFITRTDGTITRLNRSARDLAHTDYMNVLGKSLRALGSVEPWTTLANLVDAVRDSRGGCTAQASDASHKWDISGGWFHSAADHEDRAILVLRDVSTIERLQESVRRGEQLSALGELVGGVAHEVRNPIFGIGATIEALEMILPEDHEVSELFMGLRGWLERLNGLMESLLEYGRTWNIALNYGNLESVLAQVADDSRGRAERAGVTLYVSADSGLEMLMNANRLRHAFENLVANAIQHSPDGTSILVTAQRIPADDNDVIECAVRDHGPGFVPADLSRVFQPFFTRRRGGTGLGLSIVQRIVEEHGGTIEARNAEGGGGMLTLRFPLLRQTETDRMGGGGK